MTGDADDLHDWTVAGALIENADGGVLLVQNLRRNGSLDWTPPGGVVELAEGELPIAGLAREVAEETGLVVVDWEGPIYRVTAVAPDMGWRMNVIVYRAVAVEGEVRVGEDPDGIVVDAAWVHPDLCAGHLEDSHPWVREPLLEWLVERWSHDPPVADDADRRHFRYRVTGTGLSNVSAVREP